MACKSWPLYLGKLKRGLKMDPWQTKKDVQTASANSAETDMAQPAGQRPAQPTHVCA